MYSLFIHFTDEGSHIHTVEKTLSKSHSFKQSRAALSRWKHLTKLARVYIFPLSEILWGCIIFVTSPHRDGVFYITGPWESRERFMEGGKFWVASWNGNFSGCWREVKGVSRRTKRRKCQLMWELWRNVSSEQRNIWESRERWCIKGR